MAVKPHLLPLDFLPTLAQRRQRDFRRQWQGWTVLALLGASLALLPILWGVHLRREARTQLSASREAQQRLAAQTDSFNAAQRALAGIRAHRVAVLALTASRQDVAALMLDVMRACADGVRLGSVKLDDRQIHIDGYATTQSRVREMQKRLRSLPWVRKVSEVESSVIPEGVARQLMGPNSPATLPTVRRFALRIEYRPVAAPPMAADEIWDQEARLDDQ
ncbi:PilN domain-containing protein [Pandoraea pneumonica]|uniref:PilN domain-containing protein n=1 Tax=Pandoraea pneumonica TaxID=2508299 RepID=UPI003CFAEC29